MGTRGSGISYIGEIFKMIKIDLPKNIEYYQINKISFESNSKFKLNIVDPINLKDIEIICNNARTLNLFKFGGDDEIYQIGEIIIYKIEDFTKLKDVFNAFEIESVQDLSSVHYVHIDGELCLDMLCGEIEITIEA